MNKKCLTVVLVDDDEDYQYICQEAIGKIRKGCCFATVKNGKELIDLLKGTGVHASLDKLVPDFILLDLRMPMVDGFSALESLKQDETLNTIPVFILSTSDNEMDRERALMLDASAYYTKPSTIEEYEKIFEEILNNHLNLH